MEGRNPALWNDIYRVERNVGGAEKTKQCGSVSKEQRKRLIVRPSKAAACFKNQFCNKGMTLVVP
jgi:hypothetical protein